MTKTTDIDHFPVQSTLPPELNALFAHKTPQPNKLCTFGFIKEADRFTYSKELENCGFRMTVQITMDGMISAEVTDPATWEAYTLHLAETVGGTFVGGVRTAYEDVLRRIADECFASRIFRFPQSYDVINYILNIYGDSFEYLWKKFPDNAVVRHADNKKWYAAILTMLKNRIHKTDSAEIIEVLDIRMQPDKIPQAVDGIHILPGYHMNKKHWVSICLDGTVPNAEIFRCIDESYLLAKK